MGSRSGGLLFGWNGSDIGRRGSTPDPIPRTSGRTRTRRHGRGPVDCPRRGNRRAWGKASGGENFL